MANPKDWLEYWVDPQTWQFRGDFDGMYRDFDDPWECRKSVSDFRRDLSLTMLLRNRRFGRVLDIGCGLGAFTDRLRTANGEATEIIGVDVSATAVGKARALYPQCRFEVLDIRSQPLPEGGSPWDCVIVTEVFWYVLPELGDILAKIYVALASQGILFVQQYFPAKQNFGLEYLTSPAELYGRYLQPAGFGREREYHELVGDGQYLLMTLTKTTGEG